jgi:hypothetical protein
MTVTRAQFQILLEPKLRNIWNENYPERPIEYTRFLNISSSKKAQETDYKMTGLGPTQAKAEGADISYGDPLGGSTKVYTHASNGLAYRITAEMMRHEQYGQISKLERSLMRSAQDKQETDGASILNNAFSTSYVGFTAGEALCSTSHALLDGGTAQANKPSTDVSLGVTALQNGVVQFHQWKDDRSRPFVSIPKLLIVHPNDLMIARELLGSEYKPGTSNNEINALKEDNLSFMVSHYVTDTNAWFLLGDNTDLHLIWDLRPTTEMDTDFDSKDIKRSLVQAYSFGFGEWRGVYGSSGVT